MVSPEEVEFNEKLECDVTAKPRHSDYTLRPEVLESLFILHKLTGDPIYREWGWENIPIYRT